MVFRNGGVLRQNERWYFNNELLESVTYYKYLGIVFSSKLSWSKALETLASQAAKATYMIRFINRECNHLPVSLQFDLFDKIALPILLYGSEVWGFEIQNKIEAVHITFCKYVLGVSRVTSNCAVLGECGRKPLHVFYFVRCIKFWLTIVQREDSRITKSVYQHLKVLDESGKVTWATRVKQLLYMFGFGNVWQQQGVGNCELFVDVFKRRISDVAMQQWHTELQENRKLNVLSQVKDCLDLEKYLSCIRIHHHRTALSRFRCSNHKLSIERLRGTVDREYRFCKYCVNNGQNVIEDEYHFLAICPLYNVIRNTYLSNHLQQTKISFNKLMSSQNEYIIRKLASFIYHALQIHKIFNGL